MKLILLTVATLLLAGISIAQPIEKFYDADWKPCDPLLARFVSFVEYKDSGWIRKDYFLGNKQLQMYAWFADSNCTIHHGPANYYYANGVFESRWYYYNNKQHGVNVSFHSNGMMEDSATYNMGEVVGARVSWHRNGILADSSCMVNDSMRIYISWFDNGTPSSAGYYKWGKKTGKWQFFHANGRVSALELYSEDVRTEVMFYDENGKPDPNGIDASIPAQYPGGPEGWSKYMNKNLYFPSHLKFSEGNKAVTIIRATVTIDGKVVDAEVDVPFHPEFDKVALRAVQNCKTWEPARSHNRKVPYQIRQAVTFSQSE